MTHLHAELDSIERQVVDVLEQIAKDRDAMPKTADWTRRIKKDLAQLGHTLEYYVNAGGCEDADGGEWLFDLCWFEMDGKHVRRSPLILESEWEAVSLTGDFAKLVIGRAEHRVMIFQAKNKEERKAYLAGFLREIRNSMNTAPRDRYLFACWDRAQKDFTYDHYIA